MCVKGYRERKIILSKTYADITDLTGVTFSHGTTTGLMLIFIEPDSKLFV
jgi:hypothetical protein